MASNARSRFQATRHVRSMVLITASALALAGQVVAQGVTARRTVDVVFVGFNHNLAFLHPGFSPAHIRALLSRIRPVAVCLELLPDWETLGDIPTFPQEQYAAITWAREARVPIFGVDFAAPGSPDTARMTELSASALRRRFEEFQVSYRDLVSWTASRAFGESADDIVAYHREQVPEEVRTWPQESQQLIVRDDSIAENIRRVTRRYPRGPVAVLLGGYHYYPQKRRLERDGEMRVRSALAFLPLSVSEVEAGWHPDDAVLLLATNLDDWRILAAPHSRNHQRTKDLLDRLRGERPGHVVTRYYEARWQLLFGRLDRAIPILEGIVTDSGDTRLPYRPDPRWSWPVFRTYEQKARFILALALEVAGDHAAATRHYRELLALPADQLVVRSLWRHRFLDLRPYLMSLIETPFQGGIEEAFRASRAMQY